MNRKSLALYAFFIFAAGASVGALAHRLYATASGVAAKTTPASPEDWRRKFMAEMKSRVHLVPEQEEKLNGILDESKMLFDQVREKYRPEMRAIYHAQVAKVKAMLSPEQLPEYEKILAERERARAEAEKKAK